VDLAYFIQSLLAPHTLLLQPIFGSMGVVGLFPVITFFTVGEYTRSLCQMLLLRTNRQYVLPAHRIKSVQVLFFIM
jgi:hypothetical protein